MVEIHGYARRNAVHPLYSVWTMMKQRCYNPKSKSYEHYGARGIAVHAAWRGSFPAFIEYIENALGPKPSGDFSLDRVDNDGPYAPGNLRWADRLTQRSNSRASSTEACAKVRRALIGRKASAKTRGRMRAAWRRDYKARVAALVARNKSTAQRAAVSRALRGKQIDRRGFSQ
jgi:hypothetical protein